MRTKTKQSKPKGIIPGIMILMAAFAECGMFFRMFGGVHFGASTTEQIQCSLSACYDAKSGTVSPSVVTGEAKT